MTTAADSHWSTAAGSPPPSAAWVPWSPVITPAPLDSSNNPTWNERTIAIGSHPTTDTGSWVSPRSSSSNSLKSLSDASDRPPIEHASSIGWLPDPPALSSPAENPKADHGPRSRASILRGYGGGNQRKAGGGGRGNHNNAYRGRQDNYNYNHNHNNSSYQNCYQVRPQRPVFQQFVHFRGPPQIRSYPNMMGIRDAAMRFVYVPVPGPPMPLPDYFPSPSQVIIPSPQESLRLAVLKQIEYYFSEDNLCKDLFLRQNMDGEGWVPISLIAGFKKVMNLNTTIPFILDTIRNSSVVEVKGNMIRTKFDPLRWPVYLPTSVDLLQSYTTLESQMKNMGLTEGANSQTGTSS